MVKNHLKRLNAPRSWPIDRKKTVWIMRPNPGAHKMEYGVPLTIVLREMIKHGKTLREVKQIMHNKEILVDGKMRKDRAHTVGLMDVISIPELKENYRILFTKKGKLNAINIEEKEAKVKLCKISGKSNVKGKTQLNTQDGRNILAEKDEYKVGDSLVIKIPEQKIDQHLKFEKGAMIYLIGGKHIGETGHIENIERNKIIFKTKDNNVYETLKKFAFVIGKDKPIIKVE